MTLDCTDIFRGADGFPAGLAAAGNSGGQHMQAGQPVAGTVAPGAEHQHRADRAMSRAAGTGGTATPSRARSRLLHPGDRDAPDQLDLSADADAAAKAAAEALAQQRADQAPGLSDSPARRYRARQDSYEAPIAEYGSVGSPTRSRGRQVASTSPVADTPTDRCQPTLLSADLRCQHYSGGCACVGELYDRGACPRCPYESPVRDRENPAVDDGHDHARPGRRHLPTVPRAPERTGNPTSKTRHAAWADPVCETHPAGWLAAGGPIRTLRDRTGGRHVPHHNGLGGDDLAVRADDHAGPESAAREPARRSSTTTPVGSR